MKHLKYFESKQQHYKKFWLISTKSPEYELTLDTLGVPIDSNFRSIDYKSYGNKKIYLAKMNNGHSDRFEWNEGNRYGYVNFIGNGYEYMGELKIPEDVIAQHKFNL